MTKKKVKFVSMPMKILKHLAEQGNRIFDLEEFVTVANYYNMSKNYSRVAIHHLKKGKWIEPLKKGLYAMSPGMTGNTPIHEFEIAMALAEPAAIGYRSALQYHGLTDQIPQEIQVITTKGASTPSFYKQSKKQANYYEVQGISYHFIPIQSQRFFGIEKIWIGETKVFITDPEKTLLDGIQKPHFCGDFFEILHAFKIRGIELDIKKIIEYALKIDTATIKRLGWILTKLKIPDTKLRKLKEVPIKGYRKLDVSKAEKGPYNSIWKIQENIFET